MVTREPRVTELVSYLQAESERILRGEPGELHFRRAELEGVREAFAQTIRRGESKLHHLGGLLSQTLFGGPYELDSVVIGEVDGTRERFTLVQTLSPAELYGLTDLDLGTRQLARLRFDGRSANLVANFVEYQPLELGSSGTYKIITRIKAEEEIWNKVADEIFALDELVSKDKQLRRLSRYVKDIFGLKIVVGDSEHVRLLHERLEGYRWEPSELAALGIPAAEGTGGLEFLEVKDYLDQSKKSGWRAKKSVVRWWDDTFEIQVQPLRNYLRERERLTRESHSSFRLKREQLRDQVAEAVPLFGFYRDLLRWLFLAPQEPPPSFPSVSVVVS